MAAGDGLRVEVRLGAGLRQADRAPRRTVALGAGATVAILADALAESDPALAGGLATALAVVAGAQVGREHPLADGDHVAFVLPVAGGASTHARGSI